MFGRRNPTDRRERERAGEQMADLRWRWRNACSATPLAPMIYTPSGVTRSVPTIEHIDLGPPVTLRVRMRVGLTIDDFHAAAPKLAPAMGVAAIHFSAITADWLQAVLVPYPGAAAGRQSSESDRQPAQSGI